jgi:hypothetical protein
VSAAEIVPSFVSHENGWHWRGALYEMHPGYGPELVLECPHKHRSMRKATECAERELVRARELAPAWRILA